MSKDSPNKIPIRQAGKSKTIVLLHGFAGRAQETFGLLPAFLAGNQLLADWDLTAVGYPTSLTPDFSGVWTADPDLTSLAGYLGTLVSDTDFAKYEKIAFVAHSMGGLIVQRALLSGAFLDRVHSVLLFGTPSGGLKKAKLGKLFKRQVKDMAPDGEFIANLRSGWNDTFGAGPPFGFWSAAGLRDEFVPKRSSHGPFGNDPKVCKWVQGDHLSMVKPMRVSEDSVSLTQRILTAMPGGEPRPADIQELAAEEYADRILDPHRGEASWESSVRKAAFVLEAGGQQEKAIEVLEATGYESPELKGMLAGRLKRRWLADPDECSDAGLRALELYTTAFQDARISDTHKQAFYNGINVAFMTLAFSEDAESAREIASEVLTEVSADEAKDPKPDMWRAATKGEAKLYLGNSDLAVESYQEALALVPDSRQRGSMAQQAVWVARLLDDPTTEARLTALF